MGEPLRSVFRPEKLGFLLADHDYRVVRDQSVSEIGRSMSAELGAATKVAGHLRIAVATLP